MAGNTDDTAHLIGRLRGRINDFILSRLAEEGVKGLAPSHGSILVVLYHEGPQPMAVLSERINRDKSTLTVLIRKLETLGYVAREADAHDSRVSIIRLTEQGLRFRALFERISEELTERIWGDTPESERRRISGELSRMLARL